MISLCTMFLPSSRVRLFRLTAGPVHLLIDDNALYCQQ